MCVATGKILVFKPVVRRVLSRLLPPMDDQAEQPIAVIHRLHSAYRRPVSLEDLRFFSQLANSVHHAYPGPNQ
jgi:hypothetical protein